MKITNKYNLPEALVKAVSMREPTGYSASMLSQSPRMVWLKRRHFGKIEKDVSEQLWAVFGTAVHAVIERNETKNSLQEEYLTTDINGVKLTGTCDHYENGIISDWKTSSVWSFIYMDADKMKDYNSQLNTYAYLYRQAGFKVTGLKIIMLFRDWQKSKAKYDVTYPRPVETIDIELWHEDKIKEHIEDRIEIFESHKNTPDDDLPMCTLADRWAKPAKYALMKEGRKTAIKLYDEFPNVKIEHGQYFEERPGDQFTRCEYCDASEYCNQFQNKLQCTKTL